MQCGIFFIQNIVGKISEFFFAFFRIDWRVISEIAAEYPENIAINNRMW